MQGVASYYLLSNSQIPMSKVDLRFPSNCPYHEPLGWQTLGFWDRRCAEGSKVDMNVDFEITDILMMLSEGTGYFEVLVTLVSAVSI